MKYCPNAGCSFLATVGSVAEYQDSVDFCLECDTELEPGDAPNMIPGKQSSENPVGTRGRLSVVYTLETFNDATWLKEELEKVGIPSSIKVSSADEFSEDESEQDGPEEGELEDVVDPVGSFFDLLVLDYHVMPALEVIQALFDDDEQELDDEMEADFIDDGFADDEDALEPGWAQEDILDAHPKYSTSATLISITCVVLALLFLLFLGFSDLI